MICIGKYVRRLVVVAVLFAGAVSARAQLTAEPSTIEFGVRRQEQTLSAEVTLANTGTSPLEIVQVRPDCSCTAGVPGKTRLEAKESTTLKVSVETRGYYGPLHRSIHIQTSAGELTIPISLTVSLFRWWTMEPGTIVMPPSQKGREANVRVTFKFTGDGTAALRTVVCSPAWLKAEAVQIDQKTWKLNFEKQPNAPAGNYTVKVTVDTSVPDEPALSFNVFVPVTSALKVSPNPIVLPTIKVGQASTREIVIQGWSAAGSPRLELARGTARLLEGDGAQWRYEVAVTGSAPGPSTQLLRIYDDASLEAEIPVILRAEPADRDK